MVGKKLTKDGLQTAEAVLGLGLVVIKELQQHGMAIVFFNDLEEVEICPPNEYHLDYLSQEEALDTLLVDHYSDDQLTAYLKGRSSRARLNNVENM